MYLKMLGMSKADRGNLLPIVEIGNIEIDEEYIGLELVGLPSELNWVRN